MALTKPQFKRRLDAALALSGLKRSELPALLVERGIKGHSAARAGHPSDDYQPNEALAVALGKILGLGQDWFEEPNLGKLIEGAIEGGEDEPTVDGSTGGGGGDRPGPTAGDLARRLGGEQDESESA
jgi:hypothetical protein